eukprot:7026024-Alexandrium_andersonii.AAC.1
MGRRRERRGPISSSSLGRWRCLHSRRPPGQPKASQSQRSSEISCRAASGRAKSSWTTRPSGPGALPMRLAVACQSCSAEGRLQGSHAC